MPKSRIRKVGNVQLRMYYRMSVHRLRAHDKVYEYISIVELDGSKTHYPERYYGGLDEAYKAAKMRSRSMLIDKIVSDVHLKTPSKKSMAKVIDRMIASHVDKGYCDAGDISPRTIANALTKSRFR